MKRMKAVMSMAAVCAMALLVLAGCSHDDSHHDSSEGSDKSFIIKDGILKICIRDIQGEVVIPDGVTEIGDEAFSGCERLSNVTIPDSVTEIERATFCDCTNLASVNIPSSVTKIGDYAFCRCESLASIVIPDGVTEIGENAFNWCRSLKSVTIPSSVKRIGKEAFCTYTYSEELTIDYDGTKAQWEAISKGGSIGNFVVRCTDGDVVVK